MRGDGGNRNAENFNGAQIAWQGVPPASLQLLGELQEGEREGDSHSCGEAGPDAVSPQVPQSLGGWRLGRSFVVRGSYALFLKERESRIPRPTGLLP